MPYYLGVDLGTTFTSAAVHRNGRATTTPLGNHGASIPSVVFIQEDGTVLTGEVAARRGTTEPERVGREFKRRLGDTQPIFLGGAPYSAEQLTGQMLTAVLREVASREGEAPEGVAVTHPANWGPYKTDLLRQAIQMADLPDTTPMLSEPEAAAISYAQDERLDPGQRIAVYDLGGGTFDAAVLQKTDDGFEVLGSPVGIERMGGIDFDAAVFQHVANSLGDEFDALDPEDADVTVAVARLREECTTARETLSADTTVTIPVLLPGVSTGVRLTRGELEQMIRPGLSETVSALRRSLTSASVEADDLHAVLLVGGSSRTPLVTQLLGAELGRPVQLSPDPTHAVALGAAHASAQHAGASSRGDGEAGASTGTAVAAEARGEPAEDSAVEDSASADPDATLESAPSTRNPEPAATEADPVGPAGEVGGFVPSTSPDAVEKSRARTRVLVGLGVVVLLVIAAVTYIASQGDDDTADAGDVVDDGDDPEAETEAPPPDQELLSAEVRGSFDNDVSPVEITVAGRVVTLSGKVIDEPTRATIVTAATEYPGVDAVDDMMETQPPDERCTDEIRSNESWACFVHAESDGLEIVATFFSSADADGAAFSLAGIHLNVFGDNIAPETAGAAGAVSDGTGTWKAWEEAGVFVGTTAEIGSPDGPPDKICVRIANPDESLEGLDTGNCWPITLVEAAPVPSPTAAPTTAPPTTQPPTTTAPPTTAPPTTQPPTTTAPPTTTEPPAEDPYDEADLDFCDSYYDDDPDFCDAVYDWFYGT